MKNILTNTTSLAKMFWECYLQKGNTLAIDATCGKGSDTLWLAQRCKRVVAFDIQPTALSQTQRKLEEEQARNVQLILDSHENMGKYVTEQVNLIVFNLGYLPGGDKHITTQKDITLKSLKNSLGLLTENGLLSVMLYWGHEEGKAEREAVLAWAKGLDKTFYHCVHLSMPNQPCPPEILLITKKVKYEK